MCRSSMVVRAMLALALVVAPRIVASEPIVISGRVIDSVLQPVSGAKVTFEQRFGEQLQRVEVVADNHGEFQLSIAIDKHAIPSAHLQAVSPDGEYMGYYRFPWEPLRDAVPYVEIRVQETRRLQVRVIDHQQQTVSGAKVSLQLQFPITLPAEFTDDAGVASFRVPVTERVEAAVAWKDHVGLDYRLYTLPRGRQADLNAVAPEFPTEGLLSLTLDGVAPLTIRVTDDQRKPLAGVRLSAWVLQKEAEPGELNLSLFPLEFAQVTDESGSTTLAWLPAWHQQVITIWPYAQGFMRSRGVYEPRNDAPRQLELSLNRLVPIRGRVTLPDGSPRAGIAVITSGAGYGMDHCSATTTTDDDGRYELLVHPEQIYLVTVRDDEWASTPRDGFAVHANQPVEGLDFELRTATRLSGRLLSDKTMQPIAGQSVYVSQYGQDLHSLDGVKIANPEGSNQYVRPMVSQFATTNEQGEYRFALGDGSFDIRPMEGKPNSFSIGGESELGIDVLATIVESIEFTGLVTDPSGKPLAGAVVHSVLRNSHIGDWNAATGENGQFTIRRREGLAVLRVLSADQSLAAIAELAADVSYREFQLAPVGSARGRLLNEDGQTPASGVKIQYGVRIADENEQTFSYRFGGQTTTEENGLFGLECLVPGHEYKVYLDFRSDGSIPELTRITVQPGEMLALGDLTIPRPPKPYTPPTLDERIADAFGVRGTPVERFDRAKELTGLVNQHLLIVFGAPSDGRIRVLMDLRYNDEEFRPFTDEFRIIAISTDEQQLAAAERLANVLDETLGNGRSDLLLVVCDQAGTKLATAHARELLEGPELSKERLYEFLRKFKTEPLDANQLLANALMKAAEEDKRVIIQETATWCGPCHMLTRFLTKNRGWEKDYLWVKMDHRWIGARELMANIRQKADGGIPWFAILDSSGNVLSTSNEAKSGRNIGYPSTASSQAHFAHMLNSTRQRLTAEEVQQLVESLEVK